MRSYGLPVTDGKTEDQTIIDAIRRFDKGEDLLKICRELRVTPIGFHKLKKRYGDLRPKKLKKKESYEDVFADDEQDIDDLLDEETVKFFVGEYLRGAATTEDVIEAMSITWAQWDEILQKHRPAEPPKVETRKIEVSKPRVSITPMFVDDKLKISVVNKEPVVVYKGLRAFEEAFDDHIIEKAESILETVTESFVVKPLNREPCVVTQDIEFAKELAAKEKTIQELEDEIDELRDVIVDQTLEIRKLKRGNR